jgi:hypothetical protein
VGVKLHHLPRHLGQHSGGMVIAAGRLDEVVPLEPASMPGRVVVQWDKDDCADLGIIKVDLLGLGMLNALEEAVPLIRAKEGVRVDLAHLPPDDPKTYAMIRAADTVGVFQIESRAQMSSLPRNAPERFYDLVVQVAIIRPGPIAGKHGEPLLRAPPGPPGGDLPAPLPRADPRAHPGRGPLPGADPQDRHGRRRLLPRRGRGAAPRDGLEALARADAGDGGEAARRHGGQGDAGGGARGDRPRRCAPSPSTASRSPTPPASR